jgi:RNB domain
VLCIHVRFVEGQSQFITSKGHWYASNDHSLRSCKIEDFASPEELAPILPYLPQAALQTTEVGPLPMAVSKVGDIPIDVATPIIKRLAQVEQDMDAFRRKHLRVFDGLYEVLADDEELVQWKIEDFVPKLFEIPYSELSVGGLLAIDRFVSQKEHGLAFSRFAGIPEAIYVRSRKDMQMKNQAINWVRMYQESAAQAAIGKDVKADLRKNPLSAFINKAHRLILKSRKIRSPTTIGLLGPSAEDGYGGAVRAVDTGETLTRDDKLILQLLFQTSQMMPPLVPPEAHPICALIYRAIGAYPNLPLSKKVAHLLLQELGLIPPWKERRINSYQLRLPGAGLWPYQERLIAKAEASCKDVDVFRDSVQHARRDWGQMPVYCIDSLGTREIDDGISTERATNGSDCVWIHVHIANPAAYISRDHPIAVAAKECLSSVYIPTRKYSMMPANFAQTISSLAADQPVLTVSSLLQPDGSVAEIQMSLGVIHNVVRLTHSAVEYAMGESGTEQATMVIGPEISGPKDDGRASESFARAIPDLLLMKQYLKHRFTRREEDWPTEEKIARATETIRSDAWTNVEEEPIPLSTGKLAHWRGDPTIVIEGDRYSRHYSTFESMPLVEHAMLLAGESAAKWCRDRNIPIFFHIATPHPFFPISRLNQIADNDFRIEPVAKLSATPKPHWLLNMWQYTRFTSPIRRYPDLVNQLQIQAYLDAVSRRSQDLKDAQSPDPLATLPFTQQELEDWAPSFGARLKILQRLGRRSEEHWVLQAFFRAFHFKEAELPEIWDFKVVGPKKGGLEPEHTGIVGFLSPFHVRADLLISEGKWEKEVVKGQYLPVKIDVVDTEVGTLFVRAVGPPSDSVITDHPVHIRSSTKAVSAGTDGPEQQQR